VACYLGKAKNPNASNLEMLEPFTHKFCGRAENQWFVLVRHISEIEVRKFFDGKADASDEIAWALRNELPCQTYVQLGIEGDRSERVIASNGYEECNLIVFNPRSEPYKKQWFSDSVRKMIAESDRFSVHCFKGDHAVRNAVDILASWGFVQSKHWPTITSRFPELNEFNAYLIHQYQLYPDGSHPLHEVSIKAPQQAENRADEDGLGFQLNGTLTENDRSILIAMLDLKADKIQPRVSKEILGAVIFENEVGDSKRAFDNLMSLKLIESKRGPSGGYYLTEQGMAIAKDLKSRSDGIVPTN
jgi:hypothetical protein